MGGRGWHLRPQLRIGDLPESFHMTILPRNLAFLDEFIDDLRAEATALQGESIPAGHLAALLASVDLCSVTAEDLTNLIRATGLVGQGGAPGAEVNDLLNGLAPDVRDRLASSYYEVLRSPAS